MNPPLASKFARPPIVVQLVVPRPVVTATEPWSRSEFERRLRAKERFYHIHHPFHVGMNETGVTKPAVLGK